MQMHTRKIWGYVGRFIIVHVVVYNVVAALFLAAQNSLPEPTQFAFETFLPYYPIGIISILGQILRSIILALVLYPFYDTIVRSDRGMLVLFGALWGISILGSVAPMPGSIEGVIYTEIPLLAHVIVLAVAAVEVLVFSRLFLLWERQSSVEVSQRKESLSHG